MNKSEQRQIRTEFQIERVVLFSDAVFAIIITIMVIDIKLPENLNELVIPSQLKYGTRGVVFKLITYAASFSFVASFWIRHLKIFGFLKDYNVPLLVYNLLFLFTVSLFPFAASSVIPTKGMSSILFGWGVNLYVIIILSSIFSQTLLTRYLVKNCTLLCLAGPEMENALQWKAQRINLPLIPALIGLVCVFNYLNFLPDYSLLTLALLGIINHQLRKKLYPASVGLFWFNVLSKKRYHRFRRTKNK